MGERKKGDFGSCCSDRSHIRFNECQIGSRMSFEPGEEISDFVSCIGARGHSDYFNLWVAEEDFEQFEASVTTGTDDGDFRSIRHKDGYGNDTKLRACQFLILWQNLPAVWHVGA